MKQNLEQCSVVAIAGAAIAVAIREQRQRKFSSGYNMDGAIDPCGPKGTTKSVQRNPIIVR